MRLAKGEMGDKEIGRVHARMNRTLSPHRKEVVTKPDSSLASLSWRSEAQAPRQGLVYLNAHDWCKNKKEVRCFTYLVLRQEGSRTIAANITGRHAPPPPSLLSPPSRTPLTLLPITTCPVSRSRGRTPAPGMTKRSHLDTTSPQTRMVTQLIPPCGIGTTQVIQCG